ncbi:MAG: inositol monophosphatase family protein [Armatimonadota bacterium]|nr:inositol monophosphatase family protein [Armatimonadota bacterium]
MILSETAAFALAMAQDVSALLMRILPEPRDAKDIRHKTATDLVTRADHEAEHLITSRIHARFPGHRVLGEEAIGLGGPAPSAGGPRWIIDPVDGTANFAHGVPWFGVSIGFEDRGRVQCGVVAVPPLGEFFVAERGRGAFQVLADGGLVPLAPSPTAEIHRALVATGLPREPDRQWHVPTIVPLMLESLEVRVMGAAAIHLAYVAAGRIDAFWEPGLAPWDVAAGILMVEEAGGRVTDWSGDPLPTLGGRLLASNGPLHPAMVEVLARGRPREDPPTHQHKLPDRRA